MTNKKAVNKSKRNQLFSLRSYLQNKAVKRAEKLTGRQQKSQGLPVETIVADQHVHGEHCHHDHEEEIEVVDSE